MTKRKFKIAIDALTVLLILGVVKMIVFIWEPSDWIAVIFAFVILGVSWLFFKSLEALAKSHE